MPQIFIRNDSKWRRGKGVHKKHPTKIENLTHPLWNYAGFYSKEYGIFYIVIVMVENYNKRLFFVRLGDD
jgi:hypothetical protein